MSTAWALFRRELLEWEGSTRLVAIMRVLLVLVAWSRFGYTLQLQRCMDDPLRMAVFLVFWPASALLLVGYQTRWASAATALCGFVLYHGFGRMQGAENLSSHHVLVHAIAMGLLALTPCGRSFSVDCWLALEEARRTGQAPAPERGPLYGQRLMAVHVAMLYLGTAWEKSYPGFLDGSRLQQLYLSIYFGSDGADPRWFVPFTVGAAWLVTAAEWVLPFGLFVPRLKPVLIPAGLLMHGLMYHQIPVATFSATMAVLYLAFLDPDRFHAFIEEMT